MTADWTPRGWGKPVAMDIDQALEVKEKNDQHAGCCPSEEYDTLLQKSYRDIVDILKSKQMWVAEHPDDVNNPKVRFALEDVSLKVRLERQGYIVRKRVVIIP